MAATEYDLLQKFVNNEKKSRTWTLISVIAFCGFAFGVIYLADRLNKANKTIEVQQAGLVKALERANSLNDSLNESQVTLENISTAFNQAKREKDSLIGLLKKLSDNNTSNNEKTQIEAIVKNTIAQNYIKPRYKVYIQYMTGYEDESKLISGILPKDYYVPGTERVTKISFPSSIKYFNDADKDEAQNIANLINSRVDKFKDKPIRIIKTNMSVSKGQLEIWLGDYKPLNTKQIIEKYSLQQQVKLQ